MPFRLYIVPVIGVGTKTDPRRPKYFDTSTVVWSGMDYGFEPWFVVGADLSSADDVALVAQPDAFALPFDLSPFLTLANVANVKNKLEAANIPGGWVHTSLTWTDVVRTVLGIFSFLQRYGFIYAQENGSVPPSIFGSGVTLDTTFGSLPIAVRTALIDTAASLSIPTTGLTAASTIRDILKAMSNYFQDRAFYFGTVAI